jgi:hypothetical protein
MNRIWLTVLVPIALSLAALRMSAATEIACVGKPESAIDADGRFNGESIREATIAGCDSLHSSDHNSQVGFDRVNYFGDVQSLSCALEPSGSALLSLGLASQAITFDQVSDVKPLIRRKPP